MGWQNLFLISKVKKKINKPELRIKYKTHITSTIPKFEIKPSVKEALPVYSLLDTNDRFDDFINFDLKKFLEVLIKFAEIEDIMLKYADNYKKVNYRINSLEKIVIPDLKTNINRIKGNLEESERENYVRLKKTKNIINKEVSI